MTAIKTGNDLDTRRKRRGGETKDHLEAYSSLREKGRVIVIMGRKERTIAANWEKVETPCGGFKCRKARRGLVR